jgi:cytosine/adenosine deaminase-related metal-dependent hydrolase
LLYRAKWIIIDSETIIENGYLAIEQGIVKDYGSVRSFQTKKFTDYGEGVIIPSLINCHTHLELSALRNCVPFKYGFQKWVQNLMIQRDRLSSNEINKGIILGIEELIESGTLSIGEISSLFISDSFLIKSPLSGVFFKEYLGNNLNITDILNSTPLATSYAGHAPHTTSPDLLKRIQYETSLNNLPFSIHLSESTAELEFIQTGKGNWADFLSFRKIDFSKWPIPEKSPVKYMSKLNLLDKKTLSVHLTYADKEDFKILKNLESKICLCLRSNYNLHSKLPDLKAIYDLGLNFCLGTDSLASCDSLNIFDEMTFLSKNSDIFPEKKIFEAATINGANALGIDKLYGCLKPGKSGNFIFLELSENNKYNLFERIVNGDYSNKTTVLNQNTIL